jgi:hypothetical protein
MYLCTMRTFIFLLTLSIAAVSCTQQQPTAGYSYTCRAYSISTVNGDTTMFMEVTYTGMAATAQQMQDSLDGPNPWNFVICQ